ncbi:hypothetical protein D3C72_1834110 [compost metagenome]
MRQVPTSGLHHLRLHRYDQAARTQIGLHQEFGNHHHALSADGRFNRQQTAVESWRVLLHKVGKTDALRPHQRIFIGARYRQKRNLAQVLWCGYHLGNVL